MAIALSIKIASITMADFAGNTFPLQGLMPPLTYERWGAGRSSASSR